MKRLNLLVKYIFISTCFLLLIVPHGYASNDSSKLTKINVVIDISSTDNAFFTYITDWDIVKDFSGFSIQKNDLLPPYDLSPASQGIEKETNNKFDFVVSKLRNL